MIHHLKLHIVKEKGPLLVAGKPEDQGTGCLRLIRTGRCRFCSKVAASDHPGTEPVVENHLEFVG